MLLKSSVWPKQQTNGDTIVKQELDMFILSLPDIYAAPGSIFIDADEAQTGPYSELMQNSRLDPRAGAKVVVANETPFAMELNNITIKDSEKVVMHEGQLTVLKPGNVYVNNKPLGTDNSASGDAKDISISQKAFATDAYDVGTVTLPDIDQDLYVVGDITNENGDISIRNDAGSITASGEILGDKIDIHAAKDFQLNADWYHSNRDPRQYIEYNDQRNLAHTTSPNTYENTSEVPGLEAAINEDESRVLALGNVTITARYLNVNGLIQSGADQAEIKISPDFNPGNRTVFFSDDENNPLPGISFGSAQIPLSGYYDAPTNTIVIDDITPAGGNITIAGQILSTGNGRLKAAHGYTSVKVTNTSDFDLIINKIDVSKKRDAKITIIQSDTLKKTVYTTDATGVTKTSYQGTLTGNSIDYGDPTLPPQTTTFANIRTIEINKTSLYHDYWDAARSLKRNDTATDLINISAIDFENNQITTTPTLDISNIDLETNQITTLRDHRLSGGDRVVFQPPENHKASLNLSEAEHYYAIVVNPRTLQLAINRDRASRSKAFDIKTNSTK